MERARRLDCGDFHAEEYQVDECESPFEEEVALFLKANGYNIKMQVSSSWFRVDLAVIHPRENRYAIGIECDGATWHTSWNARAREIWRQKILEERGWKIHRIWSTDWWANRTAAEKRLLEAVQRSI